MEPKGRAAGKLQGAAAQGGNQSEEVSPTLLMQNRAKCNSGMQTLQGNLGNVSPSKQALPALSPGLQGNTLQSSASLAAGRLAAQF